MRMPRAAAICLVSLVVAAALVDDRPAAHGASAEQPSGLEKLEHFVFIMQENRSFDHYFGTYPGAEGLPDDLCLADPQGPCVAPYHDSNLVNRGGPHDWDNAWADMDGGRMDGFVRESRGAQ